MVSVGGATVRTSGSVSLVPRIGVLWFSHWEVFFRYQLGSGAVLQNDKDWICTGKSEGVTTSTGKKPVAYALLFGLCNARRRGNGHCQHVREEHTHTICMQLGSHHNIAIEDNSVSCLSCRTSPIGLILTNVVSRTPWVLGGAGLSVSPPSDCLSPLYLWLLSPWYSLSFLPLVYIISSATQRYFYLFCYCIGYATEEYVVSPYPTCSMDWHLVNSSFILYLQVATVRFTYSISLFFF